MKKIIIPNGYFETDFTDLSMTLYLHELENKIYKLCKIYKDPELETKYKGFINLMKFLHETPHFPELVKPIELIEYKELSYFERKLCTRYGYTMESLLNTHTTLEEKCDELSLQEKRMVLFELGNILAEIKKQNMVYDDLHDANVMLDNSNNSIKFIDADSVKVLGINTENITPDIIHEKSKLVTLALQTLYGEDYSFNVYYRITEKIKALEMSPALREYISYLDHGENPEGYLTDFTSDLATDKINYNILKLQ